MVSEEYQEYEKLHGSKYGILITPKIILYHTNENIKDLRLYSFASDNYLARALGSDILTFRDRGLLKS